MSAIHVPVGKFEEEGTVQVWTETSTSGCEVLHHRWVQTLQGKYSKSKLCTHLVICKHLKTTVTELTNKKQRYKILEETQNAWAAV